MRRQFPAFGNFHLRIRAAAAAGPGHNVVPLVDLAAFETLLQERPDGFVVLSTEREIAAAPFGVAKSLDKLMRLRGFGFASRSRDGDLFIGAKLFGQLAKLLGAVPVHPVAESLRLFCLASRKPEDTALAFVDEVVDPEFVDGSLRAESQLLFDFDFHPQSLAVETVLESLVMAGHRKEPLVRVFVRATPGMVNSHRVIGSDGTVEKTPALATSVLSSQLRKRLLLKPEFQNGMFAGNKIAVGDRLKHENWEPESAMGKNLVKTVGHGF